MSFWKNLRFSQSIDETQAFKGVATVDAFHFSLARERARADRLGHGFSVVFFEVNAGIPGASLPRDLAKSLTERIRSTDEVGWYDNRHIAVLLYSASVESATEFGSAIRNTLSPPRLKFTVYGYPDPPTENDGAKGSPPHQRDGSNGEKKADSQNLARHFAGSELVAGDRSHDAPALHATLVDGISAWKRALDLFGSIVGLLILSPLLLATAALIKLVSPGPVFFRQERLGYQGSLFTLVKFRTMHADTDTSEHRRHVSSLFNGGEDTPMEKLEHQTIPFGDLLRMSCIDELPQLFNVLRGEMSLVGPRPPIAYEAEKYRQWHNGRFDAMPGMTGLWQVSGKNRLTFNEMARLDIHYARQNSLRLDLWILLRTPMVILSQMGHSLRDSELGKREADRA